MSKGGQIFLLETIRPPIASPCSMLGKIGGPQWATQYDTEFFKWKHAQTQDTDLYLLA